MLFRKYVHKCILLIVIGFSISLHVDAQVLKGVVVDSEHVGLPGVSVSIKGSGTGTITDSKGNYVLSGLQKGVTIEFSYIGMITQTFVYKGQKTHKVTMEEDAQILTEVVVVGYGQQKKESVVGSITQAKGDDLLRSGNVTTVSEALTGILPGVSTMQAAGQPGATSANILIRGQSTCTDNTPL